MRSFEEKLAEALRKDREGRGMKNSEITLVRAYQSGRVNAEGERKSARIPEGDNRTSMSVGRDTLWQEEGEQGPPGAGGGYTEGAAADAVGSDGKLNKVVRHSTWTTPTDFPTALGCGATGVSPNTRMAASGITISGTTPTRSGVMGITSFHAIHDSNYQAFIGADPTTGGLFLQNNFRSLDIVLGAITRNMSIKEIDVCDGGVAKKMLVIASDPY